MGARGYDSLGLGPSYLSITTPVVVHAMYLNLAQCYSYVPRVSIRSHARAVQSFIGNSSAARLVPVRMVEGHQCHRVGHAHRRLLLGKSFKATSPNGRFTEGEQVTSGVDYLRLQPHNLMLDA